MGIIGRGGTAVATSALLAAAFGAAACVATPAERWATASAVAASAALAPVRFDVEPFVLVGWWRPGPGDPLTVYIEGDGFAWIDRKRPSDDPTPINPVALRMAAGDPHAPVLVLARPCQFGGAQTGGARSAAARFGSGHRDSACDRRYWTSDRYAPEVVAALARAIDIAKAGTAAARVRLVGFSGGGVLAALLASRRPDVEMLVTAAAPLDLGAWTALHGVSPLEGSLDPATEAERLRTIPQRHFAGADDRVVPPQIVQAFTDRLGGPPPVVVPAFGHQGDWAAVWPGLLRGLAQPPG